MTYVDVIENEMKLSGDEPAFAGGASDQMIADFEGVLGVKFPPSYKLFLKKIGALSFGGDTYYGITKSGLTAKAVPSVLFATRDARAVGDADSTMIVVKASGYGPIFSIDTSQLSPSGESPIVQTELSFKRDGVKTVLYDSFEAFFCDTVRTAIAEL
ncbi:SMI1/KNR4 family protein [Pseudomonas sp. UBA1879]|uniref:SMI1/KNR4 family protein n=1 Tax=Pseudomonas sp. UBA1879 TaxID=1947305 RepID=UPI0025E64B7F|nr:SMI1/KNR4 family protein [Pseudomonas sp. UBA1879]